MLAQIGACSESRNPEVLPQLASHGPLHAAEIVRLLSGGRVGDFAFVAKHARHRAAQYFPLEATLALQLAQVGERVRRFERIALRDLMLHQAAPALRDLLPAWREPLLDADRRLHGALLHTLRTYAATNLNVLKTAARLEAHPNTVYARFERIRALSGLDPRSYAALESLLLVLDAARAGAAGETTAPP